MLALILLGALSPTPVCPITGSPVTDESPAVALSGVQFRFKDAASKDAFVASPGVALEKAREKGWTVGLSFFDPVARKSMILSRDGKIRRADVQAVNTWHAYKGILYPLGNRSTAAFNQDPAKFVVEPKTYTLFCPFLRIDVPSIERAPGYVDVAGLRYYLCCDRCIGMARGQLSGAGFDEAKSKSKDWIPLFAKQLAH